MIHSFGDRQFQTWFYRVSHGELLIRSPRSASNLENIDLMFFGVVYMALPRFLPVLDICSPTDEEIVNVRAIVGVHAEHSSVFVLRCRGDRFLVAAASMRVNVNQLDIFDLPFERE